MMSSFAGADEAVSGPGRGPHLTHGQYVQRGQHPTYGQAMPAYGADNPMLAHNPNMNAYMRELETTPNANMHFLGANSGPAGYRPGGRITASVTKGRKRFASDLMRDGGDAPWFYRTRGTQWR